MVRVEQLVEWYEASRFQGPDTRRRDACKSPVPTMHAVLWSLCLLVDLLIFSSCGDAFLHILHVALLLLVLVPVAKS